MSTTAARARTLGAHAALGTVSPAAAPARRTGVLSASGACPESRRLSDVPGRWRRTRFAGAAPGAMHGRAWRVPCARGITAHARAAVPSTRCWRVCAWRLPHVSALTGSPASGASDSRASGYGLRRNRAVPWLSRSPASIAPMLASKVRTKSTRDTPSTLHTSLSSNRSSRLVPSSYFDTLVCGQLSAAATSA